MNKNGRPEYNNEQYEKWLEDLKPFLKIGYTLYSAIEKTHLVSHKDSIYRKYKLNDWFCEKIDAYRQYSAEIVNSIFSRLIVRVDEKIRNGEDISEVEWKNVRFYAEKHRSCKIFFSNKEETIPNSKNDIEAILNNLEENTDYEELANKSRQALNLL